MEQDDLIKRLVQLFEIKTDEKNASNREIAYLLSPGLLTAIFELLNLSNEALVWQDFLFVDDTVVVQAQITYDPSKEQTLFLRMIADQEIQTDSATVTRHIQVCLPLTQLSLPKDKLKEILTQMAHSSTKIAMEPAKEEHLALDALSDDQLRALFAYRSLNKDVAQ